MANFLLIAASSDIGAATARRLRDAGHRVITTARDTSVIEPDMILDATDFDAVDRAVSDAGELDGIAVFAGSMLLKPAHLTSREQYDDIVAASLTTSFAAVRAAGKHLRGGSVVLTSSAAALAGLSNHDAIAAAKAGVIGLTLSAAASYAARDLRINAVAPGLVQTRLTEGLTASETSRKVSEAMHPLGRLGEPDDVARAVEFLLDPANAWITGQVLGVDGGLGSLRPRQRV
ncbi:MULTISPECIES: SDR family NAD(P)-dependent oxidoreductase [unclassified Microbacterium]|uniref:SDR family NAD(P)-dependent oxidoreductase n=1 Tax=unclassified Microbacterium TaxID=2609290 RepID=UPI00097C32C5|nr:MULTISPECIES: SDR family oxidoreductase [unclassified Microbacterium]MDI9892152.1 SDR family oxidoreductase [Microbacterium sp. IEGM 1404]MXS74868.1 SDR family oxidoreductase [Microbacterium sp. TL13]ONI65706.1 2-deoxy-D-gluconate 3-dehydrogenase [Microbacterium sp. CSI-V]